MRRTAPVKSNPMAARSSNLIVPSVSLAILLWGCGQPDPGSEDLALAAASSEPDQSVPTLPVVGGDATPVCGFPMTAKIPGCTAVLVTPTILLTAKHCGPKAGTTIQFGEKTPFEFSVQAIRCVTAKDSDAAYCVLPDDPRLKKVPTVPVLHGCEYTKFMKPGARIVGVGFGQTMGTGPARTKNDVEVPVVRVRDPFIDVGDKTHDLCFGDSGGGAFIHLVEGDKDWGWRVIGTVTGTARGVNAPCGGTDYTTVLRHVKLVEETEKIDITPCTDSTGAWAPGPGCQDFLTDIKTGGGVWPDCSSGPKTTVAIDSCGAGPAPTGPGPMDAGGGKGGSAAPDGAAGAVGDAGGDNGTGGSGGQGAPGGSTGGSSGGVDAASGGPTAAGGTSGDGGAAAKASDGGGATAPRMTTSGGCQTGGRSTTTGAPLLALVALVLVRRRSRIR